MTKLSDPHYFLPVIQPLEPREILRSGRTGPMIIRGACEQTNERGEYVVKFKGAQHMWEASSLFELLGSFIAMELDIPVPEPVMVNITPDFVDLMQESGHENFSVASRSIGLNFGSALQNGFQEVIPRQSLPAEVREQLFELFAFDVFVGNSDRRHDKPNFLSNGNHVLAYDHELAFGFCLELFKNPQPWIVRQADMDWIGQNFCYRLLKGKSFDFSNFAARLSVINGEFWRKAGEYIPSDWQHGHFGTIQNYLGTIVAHRDDFAIELNRVLS